MDEIPENLMHAFSVNKTQTLMDAKFNDLKFVDECMTTKCCICEHNVFEAQTANCGHICCRNCLNQAISGATCLQCLKEETLMVKNPAYEQNQLLVRCPNDIYGCDKLVLPTNMTSHLKACDHRTQSFTWKRQNSRSIKTNDNLELLSQLRDDMSTYRRYMTKLAQQKVQQDVVHCQKMEVQIVNVEQSLGQLHHQFAEAKDDQSICKIKTDEVAVLLNNMQTEVVNLKKEMHNVNESLNELNNSNEMSSNKMEEESPISLSKNGQEINILLLGPTGGGKSTLINSFANHNRYESFQDAKCDEEVCLIPAKFTSTDAECNEVKVSTCTYNSNECMEFGKSGTLACKSYLFQMDDSTSIRWIDSSGFGHSKGAQHDKESVIDILKFIEQYEQLHAIALVLNGDGARMTKEFQNRVGMALSIFPKTAADNMIFIFTRRTQPQDALTTLKAFLKKSQVEFKVGRHNVFSFENESFQHLLKAKRNFTSREDDNSLEKPWRFSAKEYQRLLNCIVKIKPYNNKETLVMNHLKSFTLDIEDIISSIKIEIDEARTAVTSANDENSNPLSDHNFSQLETECKTLTSAHQQLIQYFNNRSIFPLSFHDNDSSNYAIQSSSSSDTSTEIDIEHIKKKLQNLKLCGYKIVRILSKYETNTAKYRELKLSNTSNTFTLEKNTVKE